MIRKRPEKDTVNPPGQMVYDPVYHNMDQWRKWEQSRKQHNAEKYPIDKELERIDDTRTDNS